MKNVEKIIDELRKLKIEMTKDNINIIISYIIGRCEDNEEITKDDLIELLKLSLLRK